jgi:hypothetical protein
VLVDQRGELEVVGGLPGFLGGESEQGVEFLRREAEAGLQHAGHGGRFLVRDRAVHAHHFQQQGRRRDLQRMLPGGIRGGVVRGDELVEEVLDAVDHVPLPYSFSAPA